MITHVGRSVSPQTRLESPRLSRRVSFVLHEWPEQIRYANAKCPCQPNFALRTEVSFTTLDAAQVGDGVAAQV